tara:strand:- start:5199 stop:5423 length:225 start_codon:yes stop_codon:yes gene_type:complete
MASSIIIQMVQLIEQLRVQEPVTLFQHIHDNYSGSPTAFARSTGRHVNSVTHQMKRGAIWYKDDIYLKTKKGDL